MSKIVKLEAESFKRLRAVEITPSGSVVQIRGANGEGKSSCLDAIAAALGGERLCPAVPIRKGEDKAHVTVELEDLVVTRRWTAKGSYLEVCSKDGAKYKTPQAVLDALVGQLSFDPVAFTRYEPKRQLALLRDLVKLDTSNLDATHQRTYDERTVVNREVERLKASLPAPVDAPDTEVDVGALLAQQERDAETKAANDASRRGLDEARRDYQRLEEQSKALVGAVTRLETELAQARKELETNRAATTEAKNQGLRLAESVKKLVDPDPAALREQLRSAQATNDRVRAKRQRAEQVHQLEAKLAASAELTEKLEELVAARTALVATAQFPVSGLGFGAEGITFNGLPFEQASSAEQLRIAVAMGLALNPKLRVLLVRDGSLLDDRNLAAITEMAEKANAQVWLEVVGTGPAGIVIEDGGIAGAPAAVAKPAVEVKPAAPARKPRVIEPEPEPAPAAQAPKEDVPF